MDAQEAKCKCGHSESQHDVQSWNGDEYCNGRDGLRRCACPSYKPLDAATRLSPQPETAQGESKAPAICLRCHKENGPVLVVGEDCLGWICGACYGQIHDEPSQQENAPQPQQERCRACGAWICQICMSCSSDCGCNEPDIPCDCWFKDKQVCDICQGWTGNEKDVPPAPSQPQPAESDGVREHIAGLEQRLYDEQQSHQSTMRTLIAAEAKLSSLLAQKPELEKLLVEAREYIEQGCDDYPPSIVGKIRQLFKDAEKGQGK